jgi:hypothetical protein
MVHHTRIVVDALRESKLEAKLVAFLPCFNAEVE